MQVVEIPINQIEVDISQPRKSFENIGELASSILKEGLIEPLKVMKNGDKYILIDGERRFRALNMLYEKENSYYNKVKCIVMKKEQPKEKLITQLVTDLQKEKLNPLEEAEAFKTLIEIYGFSINDIKMRVSKKREYITKRLKLLAYSPETIKKIQEGKIKISVAEAIDIDTIHRKEGIIMDRIEKEDADCVRAREIIAEENYKYEWRINSFINKLNQFLDEVNKFNTCLRTDIQFADVLKPYEFKIHQAITDLDKLEYNLNKIDSIKEEIKEVRKKLNSLFKKNSKETIIEKEMLK
jgi:ParB/RepB/Spo0J family partition protein